ncbi:MAG: ABC transporter permease [Acidimicrobiales bacterium]
MAEPSERLGDHEAQKGPSTSVTPPPRDVEGLMASEEGALLAGPGLAEREFTVASRTRARMVAGRFLHHRLAMVSLVVFVGVGLLAVIGGHVWHYGFAQITNQYAVGPSAAHPFGTDDIGHDLFAQVLRGTEKEIQVALMVAIISTTVGSAIGALAGFYGKLVDGVLMRFTDLVLAIPVLAVLLVLANLVSKQTGNWFWIGVIIAALSWTYVARLVRGTFLSLREKEYVEAARAIGASDARIILRHLLPNAVGPIIVNATLTVAYAILIESTLSYLGLGIQPPDVSLGLLISNGQASATTQWWLFAFPAIFIVILVLAVNFIGDGMRDAFDPTQNRVRA